MTLWRAFKEKGLTGNVARRKREYFHIGRQDNDGQVTEKWALLAHTIRYYLQVYPVEALLFSLIQVSQVYSGECTALGRLLHSQNSCRRITRGRKETSPSAVRTTGYIVLLLIN